MKSNPLSNRAVYVGLAAGAVVLGLGALAFFSGKKKAASKSVTIGPGGDMGPGSYTLSGVAPGGTLTLNLVQSMNGWQFIKVDGVQQSAGNDMSVMAPIVIPITKSSGVIEAAWADQNLQQQTTTINYSA